MEVFLGFWGPVWLVSKFWIFLYFGLGVGALVFLLMMMFKNAHKRAYGDRTGTFSAHLEDGYENFLGFAGVTFCLWPLILLFILYENVVKLFNKITINWSFKDLGRSFLNFLERKMDARDKRKNPERYI